MSKPLLLKHWLKRELQPKKGRENSLKKLRKNIKKTSLRKREKRLPRLRKSRKLQKTQLLKLQRIVQLLKCFKLRTRLLLELMFKKLSLTFKLIYSKSLHKAVPQLI